MTILKWLFFTVIFVPWFTSSSGKHFYKNSQLRQESVITNQGNLLFNEEVKLQLRSKRDTALGVDRDASLILYPADAPEDSTPGPTVEDASELPTCLLCVCLTGSVYCEEVVPDMTAVPTLPKETAYFYARYNKIKKITANDFADTLTLRRIDLTGNLISDIEDGAFSKLSMLEELSLAENQLVKLPMLPSKLTSFNANFNQLSTQGVKSNAFEKLTKLVNLFLANNILEAIPQIPESVRVVHLQNNNIDTISDDSFCKGNDTYYIRTNLNEVRMDGNPVLLAKYPNSFTCLKSLPIGKYH